MADKQALIDLLHAMAVGKIDPDNVKISVEFMTESSFLEHHAPSQSQLDFNRVDTHTMNKEMQANLPLPKKT